MNNVHDVSRPVSTFPVRRPQRTGEKSEAPPSQRQHPGGQTVRPEDRPWLADGHAGEVGGDAVGGVAIEVGPGHVVADGGSGLGVAHRVLHVP